MHARLALSSCPTHGVLHAAGVSTNTPLQGVGVGHFATAFGPKALGATNIHAMTAQTVLDASILISSVSTFWCRPGQGCYAAANAFLDAHAHASRAGHGQSSLGLSLPGVESIGMGAALNVRRSMSMSLDDYDASVSFMLMANFATVVNAVLPSSLKRFVQGTSEEHNPLFIEAAGLKSQPGSSSKAPFALQSCRLEGRVSVAHAAKLLEALTDWKPAVLELVGLRLEADDMLISLVESRRSPLIVLCRGELGGDGAMLLLGKATCALGDATAVLDVSRTGITFLRRRASMVDACPAKHNAAAALQNGWLDQIHDGPTAGSEAGRIATRFANISADLLATCKTRLPAPLAEVAVVAMGTLHLRRARPAGPRLVRVSVDEGSAFAIVELCDEKRSNTISHELGEDVGLAASMLRQQGGIQSISLHGKGLHFSVGVNPYNYSSDSHYPLAASAFSCEQLLDGFIQLRGLSLPFVCAVHGKLIGAALAACLNADYIVAHVDATFCHGNIVRGVCPLGMLSQTLVSAVGCSRALAMYMTNDTLTSSSALTSGLISEVCHDNIRATQVRAIGLASYLATHSASSMALIKRRDPIDQQRIACEALGHATCLAENGGRYADTALPQSTEEVPKDFVPMTFGQSSSEKRIQAHSRQVQSVEVTVALTQESLAEMLHWPEAGLLVVRAPAEAENFCLGGNPTPSRLKSGDFLHDVPAFARLLAHLQRRSGPSIVICKGATRGFGMLFPCMGTCVMADSEATFGFPEVRRGVLPGVVSVAAMERLSPAVCEQLFCTGDAFDSVNAKRLGLVDLLCGPQEAEMKLEGLVKRFRDKVEVPVQAPPVLPKKTEPVSIDGSKRVARLNVRPTQAELACNAVQWISASTQLGTLRVLVINIEGEAKVTKSKDLPSDAASRLGSALMHLTRLGVLVLCSVRGHMTAAQLHFLAHAHYRMFDSQTTSSAARDALQLLQKTLRWDAAQVVPKENRLSAAIALEMGIASEVVEVSDGDVEQRVLQLAQGLVGQPPMGVKQMLNVTFLSADSNAQHTRSKAWRQELQDGPVEADSQVSELSQFPCSESLSQAVALYA
jgi:enoyl-CoA hydratase/carnithine racemase